MHIEHKSADQDYLGLRMSAALKLAANRGDRLRAVSIDGNAQICTRDYRLDRVNVSMREGVIDAVQSRG